ncbi:hypothetical protein G8D96_21625 [Aeromonas hydrophila]|uniref:hypothetical protein n=1 Tax=Aeromonas hydrophila TaxID=644 RepID=UPI00140F5676|nr:hypothetical protein [Aeromonas hydrophila]NHT35817.1 hypothetical protein [Aeromonas hydrophila]
MPIIDVDHVGGLPEGSLIALSNHELALQLLDTAKAEEGVGAALLALIEEAALRLTEAGE